jgi:hypothetical protein
MKTIGAICLAVSIAAFGCGKSSPEPNMPIELVGSEQAPAAQGRVHVNDGGNGNAELIVEVKHLARPEKAAPGATSYVVWVHPSGGHPQNLGALSVDDELTGSLRTVTPLKDFKLFVTPEPSPQAVAPSNEPVLSGHVSRD